MLDAIVAFFTDDGLVALIAIFILVGELSVFVWWGRVSPNLAFMIPNALSGVAMLGALLVAMRGANPLWILVFLTGGFVAHLADLWLRLGRKNIKLYSASYSPSPVSLRSPPSPQVGEE
jgi:hypothetical protein